MVTFNRLLTRLQVVQIMEKQFVHLCYISSSNKWTRVSAGMTARLHFLAWMWLFEQLLGNLSEIIDEANGCIFLQRIVDVVDINVSFIK